MSHSSACRGQVEPLAAIVAVVAVGVGLSLYTGALADALPGDNDRTARPTAERVERTATVDGAVVPDRLSTARAAVADGRAVNVTLATSGREWYRGPRPPGDARTTDLRVPVRTAPGEVRPGRLTVQVWR